MPGGAVPLGWDLSAAIEAKVVKPDHLVVNVVGDYGFGFCGEDLAMAVMYGVPIVIVVINNGYLSLIRQAEKYIYDMNFEVETWYQYQLMDFVKFAEAYGGRVERETNVSMRTALDKITEYEPLPSGVAVAAAP